MARRSTQPTWVKVVVLLTVGSMILLAIAAALAGASAG